MYFPTTLYYYELSYKSLQYIWPILQRHIPSFLCTYVYVINPQFIDLYRLQGILKIGGYLSYVDKLYSLHIGNYLSIYRQTEIKILDVRYICPNLVM